MEASQSRPWSDIQLELLVLVIRRLPSLADRVRLRAVCRPWRCNSMLQPLPLPFPWLTLPDGTFLNIPSGEIHHMSVPVGASCHASIDNWLFLMHSGDMCSLMNPFSKATLELPNLVMAWHKIHYHSYQKPLFYKLVAPSPLDSSPDSLVAVRIMDDGNYGTLCISQPPVITDSFRDGKDPVHHLGDVAFFDGKLCALGAFGQLSIVELDRNLGISSIECIIDYLGDLDALPRQLSPEKGYMIREYLVGCGGRLLMVKRWIHSTVDWALDDVFERDRTVAFGVFEADLRTNPGQWRSVSELGGHALFVGQHSSKCLPAGEFTGYQEDCIYFMCDYSRPKYSANPLRDSGMYNMRNGMITSLLPGSAAVPLRHAGQWRPAWFFPPEAV